MTISKKTIKTDPYRKKTTKVSFSKRATKKVVRKAYKKPKQEYKVIKIKEENVPGMIATIEKAQKKFKKYNIFDCNDDCCNRCTFVNNCECSGNPHLERMDTPKSIIDRLQKYKSIKVPEYVYNNMIMFRNDLIKTGYDNWLPQIKKAMRHRINPATSKLVSSRFITMGDIANLAFIQLKIELNRKDFASRLGAKIAEMIGR